MQRHSLGFGYRKPSVAWSKWDNYTEQYLAFEYYLRDHITGMPPLRWEFKNWIEEARNIISEEK